MNSTVIEPHRQSQPGQLCHAPEPPSSPVTVMSDREDLARGGVDIREALFNAGDTGSSQEIQVSAERITRLRGILFDLDPDHIRRGWLVPEVPTSPSEFYRIVVRPMLDRHPVLAKAEVRNSGRGLHAILRLGEPLDLTGRGDQQRWAGIVKVIQTALPIDPHQPGITATTRAIGSVNSKNGAQVEQLTAGEPVTVDELRGLYRQLCESPFRTVLNILSGTDSVSPCPICAGADTRLTGLDRIGRCYSCGNVSLEALYDVVLVSPAGKGGDA